MMRSVSTALRPLSLLVLASMLAACVSTPTQHDERQPQPQARLATATVVTDEPVMLAEVEEEARSLPPEALPEAPQIDQLSVESLLKEAQARVQGQQPEQAIATLRQILLLEAAHPAALSLLPDLLIQQGRAAEAAVLLQAASGGKKDLPGFERLLAVLQRGGSAYQWAMTAQEAVAAHPAHLPFLLMAVEALLEVEANDQAWLYWQRLPQASQNTPQAQWLSGRLHEARGQPAVAWAAYRQAAPSEPRAREAAQRLAGRALNLQGWQYFIPAGWIPVSAAEGVLLEPANGTQATLRRISNATVSTSTEQALLQSVPVSQEELTTLLTAATPEATAWVQLTRFNCPAKQSGLCLHVAPAADFAGLFPDIHLAALQVGADVLLVRVEGNSREEGLTALELLASQAWLVTGE